MNMSIMRTASRIFAVAGVIAGAAATAACGSARTDSSTAEHTGKTEGAIRCRPGTECDPALGIGCDPSTMCCYQGTIPMSANSCGQALYNLGCRSVMGNGKATAVESDGRGHWWLEVYCPSWVGDQARSNCVEAGIVFDFPGDLCTTGTPGPDQVDVIYDPNCPSGCPVISNN